MCVQYLPVHAFTRHLLTQPSLHHLLSSSPAPPSAFLISFCVCVCAFQKYPVRRENHNYHSCQIMSVPPPSTSSCQTSALLASLSLPPAFCRHNLPSFRSPWWSGWTAAFHFLCYVFSSGFFHSTFPQVLTKGQKIKEWKVQIMGARPVCGPHCCSRELLCFLTVSFYWFLLFYIICE